MARKVKIKIGGEIYTFAKSEKTKSKAKSHAKYIREFSPKDKVRVILYMVGKSKRYGIYTRKK